jgi:GAF domain-containing protein
MVRVSRQTAERIADLARLLLDEPGSDTPLHDLIGLSLELIPGTVAAGAVAPSGTSWVCISSPKAVTELHRGQLLSGTGPVAETARYGEARRIDDADSEQRWPAACAEMAAAGYASCLALPLRTDQKPGGALVVYGRERDAFATSALDLAHLFAAQGGVALRNASAYRNCRELVSNLHTAMESRAVIEQAKGILVAEQGCDPDTAFKELSRISQNSNRKVRDIAADLVAGRAEAGQFPPGTDA